MKKVLLPRAQKLIQTKKKKGFYREHDKSKTYMYFCIPFKCNDHHNLMYLLYLDVLFE